MLQYAKVMLGRSLNRKLGWQRHRDACWRAACTACDFLTGAAWVVPPESHLSTYTWGLRGECYILCACGLGFRPLAPN